MGSLLWSWLGRLVYRTLLLAWPRALRRAHGVEMQQLARDRWREAVASGRTLARARVACELAADLLRSAPAQHVAEIQRARAARYDTNAGRSRPAGDVLADLHYALRLARLSPMFTGAAVLTLGLGIGAAVVMYGLVDATLLRPLPVRDVDSLYALRESVSYPDYRDHARRTDVFDSVVAVATSSEISLQGDHTTELVSGAFVSGNFFTALGVRPQLGRVLLPSDDPGAGAPLVAVVSDRFWRTRLGGNHDVPGSTLRLNGRTVLVVGVAAQGFRGVSLQDAHTVWMPLSNFREVETSPFFQRVNPLESRGMVWLRLVTRVKPGTTPAEARAAIVSTHRAAHPKDESDPGEIGDLRPLRAVAAGVETHEDLRRFLLLLAGLAALVLLIACANLANMLLVRAAVRRREMAVRLALGAARGRVVRQLLAESLLLAAAGGMAGVLIAQGIMAVLGRFRLPGNIPIAQLHVAVDLTMLAVVVGVSGSTALVFGLLPAVQASGVGIVSALKDRARTTSRNSLRGGLIAAQVALSLTLLVWSALFVRGVERALGTNLGFRSQGAAVATVNLGLERYGAEQAREFYLSSLERIEQLPAVRAAAWARMIPMRGVMMSTIDVDGYRPAPDERVYTDLIARADGGAQEIVGTLVRELQAVAPRLPIAQAMTLEDHVRSQVLPQRLGLTLFGSFGLLAVAIAAVGIHGVAADVVTERTRELGIRMALGAASRQVILLVQRQTLVPVGAGLGIGLIASIWASRLAGSLMFGLDPHDPAAFAAVVVVLTIVAALAAWFPARRAARVDPTIALRHE